MPLERTAENLIEEDWKYFYNYSLGCIGTLKIWLTDALSLALDENPNTLTKEHLDSRRKNDSQINGMYQKIIDGEARMEAIQSSKNIDKMIFGATKKASNSAIDVVKSSPKYTKPFEANPKRRKVME